MIICAKTTECKRKTLECGEGEELKVLLCGVQLDGTITLVQVDADGRLVLAPAV